MPKNNQITSDTRYMVIPRTLTFITKGNDEILLIKGSAGKKLWASNFNGVGGHIERGEDVISSARREILEETGLVVHDLKICAIVSIDVDQNKGILMFVLRGEYISGVMTPSPEGELVWVKLSELKSLPVVEDLTIILPKIMDWKLEDPPLSIRYCYDSSNRLQIRFID